MIRLVSEFGFLMIIIVTGAILIFAVMGALFLVGGRIGDKLRKPWRPSDKLLTNASLTCEHGHKVRVYINMPGAFNNLPATNQFSIYDGNKVINARDRYWVRPRKCPVCGGRWLMPERHNSDDTGD